MTPEPQHVLELNGIGRTFDTDPPVHALSSINLTVDRGDYLTVVGPSGSGKSTLLNVLGLLDRPSSGTYRIDGTPVTSLRDRQLAAIRAQRIGFVFQAFSLLAHRSAVENVELGLLYREKTPNHRQAALAALDRVGLSHRAFFLPTRMSGGEQQRVAIARAVVGGPSVLLCDEPTGNLDSTTSEEVLQVFEDLRATGITVVIVTHDPTITARADRIVTMDDGRVIS
ncbi:MAG: ABC transporter ATP-binding protein [Acidimicrobiia bacterium]